MNAELAQLEDRCFECAKAGFPNVLAHYRAVPKGASHDGKAVPPLCWDHKHGKRPRHFGPENPPIDSLEKLVDDAHKTAAQMTKEQKSVAKTRVYEERLCKCGCGTKFTPTAPGHQFASLDHKPKKESKRSVPKKRAQQWEDINESKSEVKTAELPFNRKALMLLKEKALADLAAIERVCAMMDRL